MAYLTKCVVVDEMGGGVARAEVSIAPVAYDDGVSLKAIDSEFKASNDATFQNVVADSSLMYLASKEGNRRIFPTRDERVYIELGAPLVGGMKSPLVSADLARASNTMVSANEFYETRIIHGGHFIKWELECLKDWRPPDGIIRFPVSLSGLDMKDDALVLDGKIVSSIRRPTVYDSSDPLAPVLPIRWEVVSDGGQLYIVYTLPDMSRMRTPVIDPTFTDQGTTGMDSCIKLATPTDNNGTSDRLDIGAYSTDIARGIIQFDVSSIDSGSTVSSSTLDLYLVFAGNGFSGGTSTLSAYRIRSGRDWVESQVTYNIWKTSNNWSTAGCGDTTNDRESSAIGSVSIPNSGNVDDGYQISLTASLVQEWISGAATNRGMLLKMSETPNDLYLFGSSENATAGRRPKMTIDYSSGATDTYSGRGIGRGIARGVMR